VWCRRYPGRLRSCCAATSAALTAPLHRPRWAERKRVRVADDALRHAEFVRSRPRRPTHAHVNSGRPAQLEYPRVHPAYVETRTRNKTSDRALNKEVGGHEVRRRGRARSDDVTLRRWRQRNPAAGLRVTCQARSTACSFCCISVDVRRSKSFAPLCTTTSEPCRRVSLDLRSTPRACPLARRSCKRSRRLRSRSKPIDTGATRGRPHVLYRSECVTSLAYGKRKRR
jgi:hypothetical protein